MPTTSNASRMCWAWWILPALSLLASLPANAQTALEYFDRGVTNYVFRRLPEATLAVRTGLEKYPEDPNLTRLAALLREEEQKQQQQQQQQQERQEQQDSQPQEEQAGQQQEPSKPQSKEEEAKEHPQPQPQDAPSSEQEDASKAGQTGEQNAPKPGTEPPAPQPGQADHRGNTNALASASSSVPLGQMTPEQARQLLEAARFDERAWQLQPPTEARRTSRPIRDW